MLVGRFLMMVPAMAIAGSLVGKKAVPESLGTFPTDGTLFVVLLIGVVIIVGALTFFPARFAWSYRRTFCGPGRKGLLIWQTLG